MALSNLKGGPLSRCCCCSLRTGTIIITVGHFLLIAIVFITSLVNYVKGRKEMQEAADSIANDKEASETAKELIEMVQKVWDPAVVMTFIIVFIEALFAVFALVGVLKKSPIWMKPWIVYNAHQWIVMVILAHYMLSILWGLVSWAAGVGSYVGMAVVILIQGYCILVVYSYNNNLERERDEDDGMGRLKSLA